MQIHKSKLFLISWTICFHLCKLLHSSLTICLGTIFMHVAGSIIIWYLFRMIFVLPRLLKMMDFAESIWWGEQKTKLFYLTYLSGVFVSKNVTRGLITWYLSSQIHRILPKLLLDFVRKRHWVKKLLMNIILSKSFCFCFSLELLLISFCFVLWIRPIVFTC